MHKVQIFSGIAFLTRASNIVKMSETFMSPVEDQTLSSAHSLGTEVLLKRNYLYSFPSKAADIKNVNKDFRRKMFFF